MIRWARRPPFALSVVKWPLVLSGLVVLWLVAPVLFLLGGFGDGGYPPRPFPGAK